MFATLLRRMNVADAERKGHLETFQRTVDQYSIFDGVLPHTRGAAQDPGAQRMAKIAAYKLEKELESKIKVRVCLTIRFFARLSEIHRFYRSDGDK